MVKLLIDFYHMIKFKKIKVDNKNLNIVILLDIDVQIHILKIIYNI